MLKKFFANLEEIVCSIFLVCMTTVLIFNVFMRLALSQSILWMEEIAYLCFTWIVFLGAAAAYKRNLHSGIDLIIRVVPDTLKKVIAVLGMLLTLLACAAMVILSFNFAVNAWDKYTSVLYIRYTFIDLAVTAGFLMMCVHCVIFIKNIYVHKDFLKEMPPYRDIVNLDILLSGAADTDYTTADAAATLDSTQKGGE